MCKSRFSYSERLACLYGKVQWRKKCLHLCVGMGVGSAASSLFFPSLNSKNTPCSCPLLPQVESLVWWVKQQPWCYGWVLVSSLLRATLIGSLICQKYKLVISSCGFLNLKWCNWCHWFISQTKKTAGWIWTLLDEQWCEPAFNLSFTHIWPCLIIYAALSDIQRRCKINDTQDMWQCSSLVVLWIPVTCFAARTTLRYLKTNFAVLCSIFVFWSFMAQPWYNLNYLNFKLLVILPSFPFPSIPSLPIFLFIVFILLYKNQNKKDKRWLVLLKICQALNFFQGGKINVCMSYL